MRPIALVVLVVACKSSPKKQHDAGNYGDDPPWDAPDTPVVETGPVTFVLPKLDGDRVDRPGMIAVAQVRNGWRLIDPAVLAAEVTVPAGPPVSVEEIARQAGAAGVLIVAPKAARWASIAELAFALHRECWALAGAHGVARWPATCPPAGLPVPDRNRAELALWLDPGNVSIGAGPPPATFTTVAHDQLAKELVERRVVFRTLTYGIGDTTDVATIVGAVARMHAAGFTDAHWVPAAWLPLLFPNGHGADPPMAPPPPPRQVSVVVDVPVVKGALSTEEVARTVRARAGIYRACYQKELNRDPNIRGDLQAAFTIDATGVVAKVEARGTLTHEPVVTCFEANVMRLRFPAKGKTTVRVKITFAAG